jgi:hypothetical protein
MNSETSGRRGELVRASNGLAEGLTLVSRAAIEEEYSNRLISLAKATLGKDEIG